jgi:hypothetical protein
MADGDCWSLVTASLPLVLGIRGYAGIAEMALSLSESQTVNELSRILYAYLPGKAHPFANQDLSFEGVAYRLGLSQFWQGGSKLPAITLMLERTLEARRSQFCPLILEIVRNGMIYRNNKGNPITRNEVRRLNELIAKLQFKIPELWDGKFLDSLPPDKADEKPQEETAVSQKALDSLKAELMKLGGLDPQARGFAFEKFLRELFALFGLSPRGAFRLVGEQIDGSFQIGADVYLVEAKWHDSQTSIADLLVFREKVESKATWSRGLFISYGGFTSDGLQAFSKGRSTNIIGMTAEDVFFILEGEISLIDAINQKARRAAETGEFYISVNELTR